MSSTVRQREKRSTQHNDEQQNREQEKEMLAKTRKLSNDFNDEQKLPPAIRDFLHANLCSLIIWEFYFGYLFWSIFFGIGPMVMFFPMVKLAIDGYEILILSLLSPIILRIPLLNTFVESSIGKLLARIIAVLSLLSFQLENPVLRLFILSIGTAAIMIDLCTSFKCRYEFYRTIVLWTLIVSFFFFLALRIYFDSLMAAWSSSRSNWIHFIVGLLILFDQFVRRRIIWQIYPALVKSYFNPSNSKIETDSSSFSSIFLGLAFGSLLFLLHWVFGEVSLISRWASNEFPHQAPDPIPYGLFVWIGLFFGLLTIYRSKVVNNRFWASLGFIGYLLLYFARGNVSFFGGLALSIFIGSILPVLFNKIIKSRTIRIFVIGSLFYIFQIVYAVWASAYNFVPFGGTLTRETSNVLLLINFLGLYLGVYTAKQKDSSNYVNARFGKIQFPTRHIWSLLFCSFLIASYGTWSRYQLYPSVEERLKENPTIISAAIWTVHFGYDNNAQPSLDRAAQVLRDTNADIIGLLETDTAKPFFGNTDLTSYLGEKLNMFTDFGPSTKDHTWGCIILSKYPIVRSVHYLLPSPEGELAPAILATVQTATHLIDVIIVHMGNDRDDLDRKLQAETLRDIMKNSTNPLIFLGYVTSSPMSRDYNVLTSASKDIDATDYDRWCEYILYKNLIRVGYARITHAGLTDTEIQMAKFRLPSSKSFEDNQRIVTDPSQVDDPSILFNPKFGSFYRGHGSFNTHRFHMDTPKYFLPKKNK